MDHSDLKLMTVAELSAETRRSAAALKALQEEIITELTKDDWAVRLAAVNQRQDAVNAELATR